VGFEAEWLAARAPYDEAALDRDAIAAIRTWAGHLPPDREAVVVDLGSGTGAALGRARRWLGRRPMVGYAVDEDPDLLARAAPPDDGSRLVRMVSNLLLPLDVEGGPADGAVDLVVGHALADLLPLGRLAVRVAALLRPGGLAHLALVYDGMTDFAPCVDPALENAVVAAFHRHMDRSASRVPGHGGSTAGRRLGPALVAAGLDVVVDAPSVWEVRADDGPGGRRVLDRLIRFVVESAMEVGGVSPDDLARWAAERHVALAAGALTARVAHRDLLAGKPAQR
jgi:SAM-dependent methyltransferase